jgi:hypothetical protein
MLWSLRPLSETRDIASSSIAARKDRDKKARGLDKRERDFVGNGVKLGASFQFTFQAVDMRFRRLSFLVILVLLPALLNGCGRPETAATPNELDAYLQANPDIANEDAPEIESE